MQTQLAIHRSANRRFSPFGMDHERSPLDPARKRPAIGLAFSPFLGLETVQLAVMPDEWSHAHQPLIVWGCLPPHYTIGQHPGINAVRFPDLGQLLARFLQAQLLPQGFRLVALQDLERRELLDLLVKPVLAHF